ncbi:MAG: hypothetical protein ACI4AA_10220 [Lachnospiraceae bacterium]
MANVGNFAAIYGSKEIMNIGFELGKKPDPTPEEKKAYHAFKRVIGGTVALCVLFCIVLMIFFGVMLFQSIGATGDHRYGTVTENGTVRYTQNISREKSLAELGLSEYNLQPGDKVVLIFDSDTEQLKQAYPKEQYTKFENAAWGTLLGFVGVFIIIMLIYALVIAKHTGWGKDWYVYISHHPAVVKEREERKNTPLGWRIAGYTAAVVLAIILLWPQFSELIGNIQHDRQVQEMSDLLENGREAGEKADQMKEQLGNTVSGNENKGVQQAEDASQNIREIMSDLEKEQ